MRTTMRAAAVAAVATCALVGTVGAAGAASAASSHYVSISAPSSIKTGQAFHVTGTGYDYRTSYGVICLQQRVLVHGRWSAWNTAICESNRRSGHRVGFDAVANHGLPAGEYDLRLVLDSNPRKGVWKQLDWSSQHILNVHR
ncbi:hypothetical protein [Streptacidiphilus anmyonensis]|uniref:hypothetical protein n=1 Tax=Streptacidiphilus anmyonensis TaxID=405782 RepID=UPI0005A97965|nr:hypothetical protein [Streptacidiphilus anmyonensis]